MARNKASGRTGIVPATITGSDSHSGVARLEILARRQTGGRTYVIGAVDADCASGCKKRTSLPAAADLSLLPTDGRYRLQVRVTDQAGNQKTFNTGTLFLDWKAPSAPKATVKISQRDGTASALVTPGRDPAESSGRGDYYLLYPATTDDHDRAIRNGDHQVRKIVDQLRPVIGGPVRIVRSKTRQFPLPGYQRRNEQEPGYILQTDYVRTSSGERRVRLVQVGRASVRFRNAADVYKEQGWKPLHERLTRLYKNAVRKPSRPILRDALRTGTRVLSRGTFVSAVGYELLTPTETSCGATAVRRGLEITTTANSYATAVGRTFDEALRATSTQSPRRLRQALSDVYRVQGQLDVSISAHLKAFEGADERCLVEVNTARTGLKNADPLLRSARVVLDEVEKARRADERLKKQARRKGVPFAQWKIRSTKSTCPETDSGDSHGDRTYTAYYVKAVPNESVAKVQPPGQGVIYVGITRQGGKARCRQHIGDVKKFPLNRYPRLHVYTYRLGFKMTRAQAEAVEQVLIDTYGRRSRELNRNFDSNTISREQGQLLNILDGYRRVRTDKNGYCRARELGKLQFVNSGRPVYRLYWAQHPGFARWNCT